MVDISYKPTWLPYEEEQKPQNYIILYIHFKFHKVHPYIKLQSISMRASLKTNKVIEVI